MSLRKSGADCPNDAAKLMRRGVLALAVLLLACTLMAGAVSAADLPYSTTPGVLYEITEANTYTLSNDITENGNNDTLILINASDVTLNGGGKNITGESSTRFGIKVADSVTGAVTIQNFGNITDVNTSGIYHLGGASLTVNGVTIGDITNTSTTGGTIAGIYANTSGAVTIRNAKVTGTISGATTQSSTVNNNGDQISSAGIYARSQTTTLIENCDVSGMITSPLYTAGIAVHNWDGYQSADAKVRNSNVSGSITSTTTNAYGIVGWARQGSLTIIGGEVNPKLTGNFVYGVHAYGRGNIIVLKDICINAARFEPRNSPTTSTNASICIAEHTSGTNFVIESCTLTNITHAGIKAYTRNSNSNSPLTITNNTFDFIASSGKMVNFANTDPTRTYTGYIGENTCTGSSLTSPTEGDTYYKGIWGLTPGQNVPGATWTGDFTSGYTLTISGSGNYKFTDSFNLTAMTVSADNVVIDGNKDAATITAKSGNSPIIKSTNAGITLKNLKVIGTGDFTQGKFIELTGANTNLTSSVIDFSNAKTTASSSFHTVYLSGTTSKISDSIIKAGASTSSSSQCIVVQGSSGTPLSDIKITGNTLVSNTAAKYKSDNTKVSSGSIGVRIAANVASVNISENNITCQVGEESTSMNNGIAIDGVNKAVTVTANNNKFTLSGNAAKRETNKEGQIGGFGNVFYVNPASGISSNAITINADGNLVSGGTYFIYADSDNGGTSSYTLSGEIKNNKFGAITGKKYAVTPIGSLTVTSSGLKWTDNVEPAVPEVPSVTPTKKPDGTQEVEPANKDNTSLSGNTAKIGDDTAVVHVEISGDGVARDSTNGTITIPTTAEIKAVYKESPAESPSSVGTTEYQINITLNEVNTTYLPTISPAYNETKASQIAGMGYAVAAMITATNDAATLATINEKIKTGGVAVTFKVPKTWADAFGLDRIVGFHIIAGSLVGDPLPVVRGPDDGDFYTFIVKTDGFSTIVLAASTSSPGPGPVPPVPPVYSSGDGNMENSFRVLFDTIGGSFISPVTYLSYGDKISQPPAPTKDGYTFGGWYKDSACTQGWSFSEGIPGDMTLYAKWTPSSGGQSSSSQQTVSQTGSATAQQTVKATPAATQAQSTSAATPAASGTSASGSTSPAMTQAPAPVLGALLGLLAAGVLIRRRD